MFFGTVKPVQTEPPSDRADRSVFRGVRFSHCWVFSAKCLSIHAYIFTFTRKCTSNKALLTFTPQIVKNGPVPNKNQLTFFPIEKTTQAKDITPDWMFWYKLKMKVCLSVKIRTDLNSAVRTCQLTLKYYSVINQSKRSCLFVMT